MNFETNHKFKAACVLAALFCLTLAPLARISSAQENAAPAAISFKKLAAMDFDPKVDGFGFRNYTNSKHEYRNDMGADDLIRMFGTKAVCKSGNTPANCVVNAAARQWLDQKLDAMDGGHCEGLAVACLRFGLGLPFKGKVSPSEFQSAAKVPFDLQLDHSMLNYIAYYWTTQTLWEPQQYRNESMKMGPVAVVKMLIDAMNSGSDTYTIAIWNLKNGKFVRGHAITPFAVEDAGTYYRVLCYDNNYPGETRVVTVDKGPKQTWKYVTASNPSQAANNYIGDITTKTFGITPTSVRDGRCFKAPFSESENTATGCGREVVAQRKPSRPAKPGAPATPGTPATPAGPSPAKPVAAPITVPTEPAGNFVDLSLTGDGDMLIIDASNRRTGYDPEQDEVFEEIPGSNADSDFGGLGDEMPHYRLPYIPNGKPMKVIFSGADLENESTMDFVYTGPGFTVGFDGIRLDPGETLEAVISPNGKMLQMNMSNDGEMPEVYYSVDSPKKSYNAQIKGSFGNTSAPQKNGAVKGGPESKEPPSVSINFDEDTGKLQIEDNADGDSSYDVDLEQFDESGKTNKIQLNDLGAGDGGADAYEIEVGEWDGGDKIEVKHDDEGNGFDDDEEEPEENEANDINDDPEKDSGAPLMSYIYSSLDW